MDNIAYFRNCICQCTVVLSPYGLHLSVYSCMYRVTSHSVQPSHLWTAFVSVELHVLGDPHSVEVGKATRPSQGVERVYVLRLLLVVSVGSLLQRGLLARHGVCSGICGPRCLLTDVLAHLWTGGQGVRGVGWRRPVPPPPSSN